MAGKALYVYGIVKADGKPGMKWKGIKGNDVFLVDEGGFCALAHECEESALFSQDPEEIQEMLIAHNAVLEAAMIAHGGVIPLQFNTIIKAGEGSSLENLRDWLRNESESLEKKWEKVHGLKEYGLRIYYDKKKVVEEVSASQDSLESESSNHAGGTGLNYLFQAKAQTKINERVQKRVQDFRQIFQDILSALAHDVVTNRSRVSLDQEKDLLCSFSFLAGEQELLLIKQQVEQNAAESFSIRFAGPFPPYSFVQDEN